MRETEPQVGVREERDTHRGDTHRPEDKDRQTG